MSANTSINLSGLDFQEIKDNLKQYLSSQSQFSDYDFSGSNMNILLGVLAYNSYNQNFYRNMALNETFISTVQLRGSAVRRAKELGYVPWSARGPEAVITIQVFPEDTPAFITVPKGTSFKTSYEDSTYSYLTLEDYTITPDDNSNYIKSGIVIREGVSVVHKYTYSSITPAPFVLKNQNADLETLVVTVQNSSSDLLTSTYTKADSIVEVKSDSKVYYISENYQGLYEVYFGDGVLGQELSDGNIISLTYLSNNGEVSNGASVFTLNGNIGSYSSVSVTTETAALGGREKESIESIQFNAPLNYETQNRAVTYVDYRRLISREFSDVAMCSVWGGEDNSPPIYGKVFVSARPTTGTTFSSSRKTAMKLALKKYNMMSVDVEFVDPTYLYVVPDITVRYDASKTTMTPAELSQAIEVAIQSFEETQLNTFSSRFIHSPFVSKITAVSSSINSTRVDLRLQKRFVPNTSSSTAYNLTFNNPIHNPHSGHIGSVSSSLFSYQGKDCYFSDDGNGTLIVYYVSGTNTRVTVLSNAGTVDYETGLVSINSILIESFSGNELQVFVVPREMVINSVRNQLMLVSDASISIYDDNTGALKSSVQQVTTLGVDTTTYSNGVTLVTF